MPLVMSLRSGEDFFVGDERVIVGAIHGRTEFEVVVEKTGAKHRVSDEEAIELMPDVYVSAGPRPQPSVAKIAIDAPQEITILRGERYREAAR